MANMALSSARWRDRRPMTGDIGSLVGLGMRERASSAVRAAVGSSLDPRTICALHNAQRAALQSHRGDVAERAGEALSLNAWSQLVRNRPERLAPFTADPASS